MKRSVRIIGFGFLVWLIPFAVSFSIYPLKTSDRALFESIMPVAVTLAAMVFLIAYLKRMQRGFLAEGILLGAIWLGISLVLDLCLLMQGPMKMSFLDYLKDIGVAYLIIPEVCVGCGYLLERKKTPAR